MTTNASLLEFLLNNNTSQVYGSDKNYGINELSIDRVLQEQAVNDYTRQAFTNNGVGYQAFILGYQGQGLLNTTTGKTQSGGTTPPGTLAAPLDGIVGEFTNALKELGYEQEDPYIESLSQIKIATPSWFACYGRL